MLVVAAPTTQHSDQVIHAAIDSHVDYLDIQLDAKKLAILKSLDEEVKKSGLCFITEAGFHPGLPSAMVRYAALNLDRIDSAVVACYLNMGRTMPYSEAVDELMEIFRHYQGQVYKNGRWTKESSYDIRKINFGGEIGNRTCFSMFFEEIRDLPRTYNSLKDVGVYISGSHWFVDWIISPIVMFGLKLFPHRGLRPLGKFMWWGMQTFPKAPYLVLLKVEAKGEKNGKLVKLEASVSHRDGYELTAIPVVAGLMQYLDGSARQPGVWMMGQFFEPVRLFTDMKRMGINVFYGTSSE
jgi:saccharopine dehydrogenase (NAD+, L-lysine-forming)